MAWISFQSVSDFHAGVRRGLFLGTIQLVWTYSTWCIKSFNMKHRTMYAGMDLHDVSYPSRMILYETVKHRTMYFQNKICPYSMELYHTVLKKLVWTDMMHHILLVWFFMKPVWNFFLLVCNYPTGMNYETYTYQNVFYKDRAIFFRNYIKQL